MTNLEQEYKQETGKEAVLGGLPTKPYVTWFESLVSKTVSDEEIEKEASGYREIDSGVGIFMAAAFITGAKWMREKLKGTQR
jgi:hypothetical protein